MGIARSEIEYGGGQQLNTISISAGDPAAFKTGIADASRHSGAEPDQPFLLFG
jgi:hypothetical protein